MFPDSITQLAAAVLEECRSRDLHLSTAESCTGGLITGCLTGIAGSSDVVDRGFVTYTNNAKQEMIDVPASLIERHGAVSEEVARAMAVGVLANSRSCLAVSVTGIAGPGGGSAEKPVGLVHIAAARRHQARLHERHVFKGDREAVRLASVAAALNLLRGLYT